MSYIPHQAHPALFREWPAPPSETPGEMDSACLWVGADDLPDETGESTASFLAGFARHELQHPYFSADLLRVSPLRRAAFVAGSQARDELGAVRKELEAVREKLKRLEEAVFADSCEGEPKVVPDAWLEWIETHADQLRAHPDSFVAIDRDVGIVLAERVEENFNARLAALGDRARDLYLLHTSLYV